MSDRPTTQESAKMPGLPHIDVYEYGGKKDNERQKLDRRMFMQLLVFDVPEGASATTFANTLLSSLNSHKVAGVVYADMNAVRGVGLLTWNEDPAHFVDKVRPLFQGDALSHAIERRDFAMVGRCYSLGYEPDLEHVLLRRSVDNVLHPEYGWHVWYPLRRTGAFAALEQQEQSTILREHGTIGHAYGSQNLAHDVRLACHGMDANDNEFVIGLVSHSLHPLSHLVQSMRKTRQTSEFIEKMGPFFVGRVVGRSTGS
jgi:hypothetical protein